MGKKKAVRVLDLIKDQVKKLDIETKYEAGATVKDLAKDYQCSHNTMMITLGTLGYEVEPWTKPFVERKLLQLKHDKEKRIKKV